MQYRKFGKLDWEASVLGFGGFRFPIIDGDRGKVDEQETIKLLHSAIDQGVNYIGTGYLYHHGKSEVVIGKALHDGYREKVKIATKLLISGVRTLDDCDRYLNEQLKRLQLDYVDFYLLHSLECGEPSRDQQCSWTRVRDLGILDWLEQKRSEGYIRYLGFSYHGNLEAFRRIIDEYDQWTMCMILYNYIDENYQAGRQGLEYAFEKGLAVTVMEPLRGGSLVKAPLEIQALWDTASHKRTPVDWALQWIWNQPEVSVALSGMSSIEQVKQNIASANQSGPGTLTKDELALISRVRDKYLEKTTVRCSECQYCIPCPNGIKIPDIFSFYNETIIFDDLFGGRMRYNSWLSDDETFLSCVHCGECLEKCPQQIDIPNWLAKAHELLYEG
ncbi:MAG: aldo/keto reductase [Candidatus Heimdallarchaeota archaeon]